MEKQTETQKPDKDQELNASRLKLESALKSGKSRIINKAIQSHYKLCHLYDYDTIPKNNV